MDHSFEEIRNAALDLLAGRDKGSYELNQYQHLLTGIAEVFQHREVQSGTQKGLVQPLGGRSVQLSAADRERFLEVFWGLFREGVITLGFNDSNREFPFFRITEFGRRILEHQQAYFFHDVGSYEKLITAEIPSIDAVTLLYLKEAMQSFRAGCTLSATVMLGVATEHTFLFLVDKIDQSKSHASTFASVSQQRTILQKVNKFKNILDQESRNLPSGVKEDLDTNFAAILSAIRTFRNQSGHPTGKIVDREQVYVLLQLFVPYAKKMYQLMDHYS
ncbi:MAG: hypothetical protein A2Y77_15695 [Planctomycetes bacterium RBG_13_62_9]|nr:MAG: hypothetical protein A2Y77_15695 [Planctomycetes bacterium RBG_13_62_9]